MPPALCRVGGRFSRCPNPSEHVCQYCGRDFCALHTHFAEDLEAVCSRKPCRDKKADMDLHLIYRAQVVRRNRAGLCGNESCGPHPTFECSLCRGLFCDLHVSNRMYPFHDGRVVIDRPASVCAHCWQRRQIWRR